MNENVEQAYALLEAERENRRRIAIENIQNILQAQRCELVCVTEIRNGQITQRIEIIALS